jgi:chaperonin GroEL
MGSGFVPGGGVALLEARSALKGPFAEDAPLEKRAAYQILTRALEEPLRTILSNAGLDLEEWIGPVRQAGAGMGVDVKAQKLTGMVAAGILDSTRVVKAALHSAVATAALALTVDVLVHRRNPPQTDNP